MALFFIAQLVGSAVTLIVFLVLTRLLGPANFGVYNIIISSGAIAFAILFGWMATAITRYHFIPEFKDRAIAVVLGVALILIFVGGPLVIFAAFQMPQSLLVPAILVAIYCVSHASHDLVITCLRVYRFGKPFAVAIIARPVLGLILALALVFFGWGAPGAVIGMSAGALFTAVYAFRQVYKISGIKRPDGRAICQFLTFGTPVATLASTATIMVLLSQSALAGLSSLEAAGIFAAAQMLARRTIAMPMTILSRVVAPDVYEAYEVDGQTASQAVLNKHLSFLVLWSGPLLLTFVVANQTVANLLFDDAFREGVARNLPILAVAAFLGGIQSAYFSFCFTISLRSWTQFAVVILVTLLHAGVVFGMVALFGAIGAAYGSLMTAIVGLVAFALVGQRIFHIDLPVRDLAKFAVALSLAAPLPYLADQTENAVTAIGYVIAGVAVFVLVLTVLRQQAMALVVKRLWAELRSSWSKKTPTAAPT